MGAVAFFLVSMLALAGRGAEITATSVTEAQLDGNRAVFALALSDGKQATLELSLLAPHGYRMQLWRAPPPPTATASPNTPANGPLTLLQTGAGWSVGTDDVHVEVGRSPFSLSWRDSAGRTLLALGADETSPLRIGKASAPRSEHFGVSFPVASGTRFFGLGATPGRVEKRGLRFDYPNGSVAGANVLFSTDGWSVHAMGDRPASWDIAAQTPHAVLIEQTGALDLVVFLARDLAGLVSQHTRTFSRASHWAKPFGGTWIHFEEQSDTLTVQRSIEKLRSHRVPFDVVNLGRSWWPAPGNTNQLPGCDFSWNAARYPTPKALSAELSALGLSLAVEVSPMLPDGKAPTIEANRLGMVLRNVGGPIHLTDMSRGSLLDLRKPEALKVWSEGLALLRRDGVEAYSISDLAHLPEASGGGSKGTLTMQMAAAVGQAAGPTPVWITTGDETVIRRTPDSAAALRALLSAGLSGDLEQSIVVHGAADDAAFASATTLGLLSPRVQIGPAETLLRVLGRPDDTVANVMRLRYSLAPLFWAAKGQIRENGLPVMRHLAIVESGDLAAWEVEDQYFIGDDLMIAPALEPQQKERPVYLPHGRWYELDNASRRHDGPGHVQFPVQEGFAALVREGALLPRLSEDVRHFKGGPSAPLRIDVYPARMQSGESLERKLQFEDDGISVNARVVHTQMSIEITVDAVPIPVVVRFMQPYRHALLTEQRSGKQLLVNVDGTIQVNAGRGVHLKLQR